MASGDPDTYDSITDLLFEKLSLKDVSDIEEKLKHVASPFSWRLPSKESSDINRIWRTELKLGEMKETDEELISWKMFILTIVLCHEYAIKGLENSSALHAAFQKLAECETTLENDESPQFFSIEVVHHIIQATRAFLLFYSQKHEEAREILCKITPLKDLDPKGRATLSGAQASVLMECGYAGVKESVGYVEAAIKLDPNCGEWHFLLGRALGRMRRVDSRTSIPDKRELQELEKACSLTQCKAFRVLLAQAYRETAHTVFFEKKDEMDTFKPYCDTLNEKSLALYRKLLEEAVDDVHILIRCAQGLLKLPKPFKDIPLAQECILKCIKLSPENSFVNHVAGTYYCMIKETEKAIKYFTLSAKTGNYGAYMDLLKLQNSIQRNFNPVPELEKMYEKFKTVESHNEEILCIIGAWYYFVKRDFKRALEYWVQVVEKNIQSEKLKAFRTPLIKNGQSVNISRILIKEIYRQLDEGSCSEEEKQCYDKLLEDYSQHHPGLVKTVARQFNVDATISSKYSASHRIHQYTERERWRNAERGRHSQDTNWRSSKVNTDQKSTSWRRSKALSQEDISQKKL